MVGRMRRSARATASRDRTSLTARDDRHILGAMEHPIRFAVGALLALAAASVLLSSMGKPPDWTPAYLGQRRGLTRRDQLRRYATIALVAGAVVAIVFGILVR